MIQRIQTAYLLVAGLLTASLFKFRFAEITVNSETLPVNGLPVTIFIGITVLLHFIIIGMYKKRIRQIRATVFTIVLLLGLSGLFLYFAYACINGAEVAFKIPVVFPLVAIIFDFLAIRAIRKDEALVRSLNRIR